MTGQVKRILLAEDDANDVELTLEALAHHNLANEVIVTRDGWKRSIISIVAEYSRRAKRATRQ